MNKVLDFIKGVIVGISSPMPVLSGGMIAFFLGIYDDLIDAVANFFTKKEKRKEYIAFLLPVGGGIAVGFVLGILVFAKLFLWGSEHFPVPTFLLFMGLIIGSIPFILKAHHDMAVKPLRIVVLLAGAAVVATLALLTGNHAANTAASVQVITEFLGFIKITSITWHYALWMVFCGFLIAGAMVIPNFPGFALLIGLGEYHNLFYYAHEKMLIPLLFFAAGVVVGILLFSKIISFFLNKIPVYTFYFILGLIIASVVQIGFEIANVKTPVDTVQIVWGGVTLVGGFAIAFLMSKLEAYKPKPKNGETPPA
ncbi:MAG: hypothetical protein A2Y33_13225 [Spirochaetes bacterium GWF1_51_8]|nr:MAG: hypothetical protein A2Y33_13225 [Spirochaetes bacterium GWF1_51_8]